MVDNLLFLVSPASGICFGRDVKETAYGIFPPRVCHKHRHCFSKRCRLRSSRISYYSYYWRNWLCFIVIFNVMASFALLQVLLKALSQKIEASNYSFDSYGMFWGTSAILCPTLMVLLYQDIRVVCCTTNVNVQKSAGNVKYMLPFVFAFPMIVCAPVAIYFGFNFNLPTPSVYFLPAKLLCCCSEKRARALVLFTDLLVCFGCRQFLGWAWSVCCVCLYSGTICCCC